jgi:WD40 repeat protein
MRNKTIELEFFHHSDMILNLKFHKNLVISSDLGRKTHLWNFNTGQIIYTHYSTREEARCMDINDHYLLISNVACIGTSRYKLVDETCKPLKGYHCEGFSLNGLKLENERFYATTSQGYLLNAKVENARKLFKLKVSDYLSGVFNFNDKHFYLSSSLNKIMVLDRKTFKHLITLEGHSTSVCGINCLTDFLISYTIFSIFIPHGVIVIVRDIKTFDILTTITCSNRIKSINITDDKLYALTKEGTMDIYTHNNFKECNQVYLE